MKIFIISCLLALSLTTLAQAYDALEEVIVTGELIEKSVLQTPSSVSIIDNQQIQQRNAQQLEELLNLAPNVNFATGASRGRFIQIRGIGERSEFQEPIIHSVGVIMDGIDMTGISTAASTLDIQQLEVFRGPQGTLFGANALAGLVNIVANQPTEHFYSKLSAAIEDYNGLEYSAVISTPTSNNSAYRLAVKHYQSDGFTNNLLLKQNDTNNLDETTARGIYHWQPADKLSIDFTLFYADIDNGYDAFSLDNTRQTYSDQPGEDSQKTRAGAIKADWIINDSYQLITTLSHANSELIYSYDEDWSHTGICQNTVCDSSLFGFDWWYSSFDTYQRDNTNSRFDTRLVFNNGRSSTWVLGFYYRDQQIDLLRQYTYLSQDFKSQLDTQNTALYGQIDIALNAQWSLSTGLRFEQRDAHYTDNNQATANTDEGLWGGRIALEYRPSDRQFYYALISRGYKSGGFNTEGTINADKRNFDTETMLNYELGLKHSLFDNRLQLQASLFYQDRDDIQSKQSIVRSIATGTAGGPCPCQFIDFTDNAASGSNYGIELTLSTQLNEQLSLFTNIGLLKTEFDNLLTFDHINADRDNGIPFNLKGREQAHSPSYQIALGGEYQFNEHWHINGSLEAKDSYYFSDRHSEQSDRILLLHLELGYQQDNWKIALYGKNLSNETVKTRGFGSFGNDPRKFYQTEPYNQFAAPRVVGIKAQIEFN